MVNAQPARNLHFRQGHTEGCLNDDSGLALLCEGERARVGLAAICRSISGMDDVAARPDSIQRKAFCGDSAARMRTRHIARTPR